MGITEILTIVFVVLKLLGKIDWSWWLVCLPEIIAGIVYVLVWISAARQTRKVFRAANQSFSDLNDLW